MAHDNPPIRWTRHLLMYAVQQEREAQADEGQLARRLRGIYWHPASDVLTSVGDGRPLKHLQTAAASALRRLEDKYVTVKRSGHRIDSYRLTTAGRGRAEELLAHGGQTKKASQRQGRQRLLSTQKEERSRVAAALREERQDIEALLFSLDSPLNHRLLETPISPTLREAVGGQFSTYGELSPQSRLWESMENPVDQLIAAVFRLAILRAQQASGKSGTQVLQEAKRGARQRRRDQEALASHNDAVWAEERQRRERAGETCLPDDWRQLPRSGFREPLLTPPFPFFDHLERFGDLALTLSLAINPFILDETIDDEDG